MAKKKKTTAALIVRADGTVVANKEREIAPVKNTTTKKTEKSSDLLPLLNKSTKNLALSNLALRQGDVQGINKLKDNLEENKKLTKEYNKRKDREEAEVLSKTSTNDLISIDRYNKGANVSDNNLDKVFEYADSIKDLRKSGYDIDKIREIAPIRQRQTNAVEMEREKQKAAAYAKEHKVLASIASVPQNIIGGALGTVDSVSQFLIDPYRNFDTNRAAYTGMHKATAARKAVADDMSPLGSFIYQTSMSLADSLASVGVTGGSSIGSLGLFASASATNTIIDATERGMSASDALTSGMAAGFFEALFEKMPLDHLLKLAKTNTTGLKQVFKNISESVLINATEEVATEFSNVMFDTMTNEEFSHAELMMKEYMSQGMSKSEAQKQVVKALALQIGEAGLSGALMGGGFGVAGTLAGKVNGKTPEQTVAETVTKDRVTKKQKELAVEQKNKLIEETIKKEIEKQKEIEGELPENQKKAIEDRVKNEIEDIDYSTIELSEEELEEIRKEVEEDLERGSVDTFTIEKTLYNDAIQKMRQLNEEMKTADDTRKVEIQEEIDKLQAEYNDLIENNQVLKENYVQRDLKNQPFKRILTGKESEKAKAIIKSFEELKIDNSREAHETADFVIKLADTSNYNYIFTNDDRLEDSGRYDTVAEAKIMADIRTKKQELKNESNEDKKAEIQREIDILRGKRGIIDGFIVEEKNNIVINIDSPRALFTIIGHEMTHAIEGNKNYDKFKDVIVGYAKSIGVYDQYKAEVERVYDGRKADIDKEIVAFLTGDYGFTDKAFIEKLSAEQPSVFKQVYDYIKYLCKLVTAGSKEARQLEKAKRMFEKAWRESNKTTTGKADPNLATEADSNTSKNNDVVKFSLSDNDSSIKEQLRENLEVISKMQPVADTTYEDISHLNRSQKAESIIAEYDKKFKGGIERQNFGFIELDKKLVTGSLKYLYTDGEFAAFKALPQVLKRGEIISGHVDHKGRAVDTVTIAAPVVINGTIGYVGAVVKVGGKNKYHVHRILMPDGSEFGFKDNKKTEPTGVGVPIDNDSQRSTISSATNSISAEGTKNNTKFSLSDSQGRELTKEQQEFFKGSKIVDEEGNLRVVYHGSSEDFTIFDRTKARANMDIQGNFFSPWDLDAQGYGENVRAFYLNITNPAPEGIAYKALNKFKGQNGAGIKAREYLESLGYDGVNNGDEEYIAFYPHQIKSIDNEDPTDNPDINLSLSAPGENRIPVKGYAVYGSDIKLKDDIAPVNEEVVAKNAMTTEDIAPVKVQGKANTEPLDDKFLRLVGKNMRQELGLKNNQVAGLRNIIQDFSTSKDQSKENLYETIEREFGTVHEKQKLEEITGIKAALKFTKIKVSDAIKTDITDYATWKQKQFNKLRISNEGMNVDVVYEELKEIYPHFFPEDITNPTDQLLKIAEVASMDSTYIEEYSLSEEDIQNVVDYIYESVEEYKQLKNMHEAEPEKKERTLRREIHRGYMDNIRDAFSKQGYNFDDVLSKAKSKSTFSSVDNTPQRFIEKTLGYKEGQILNDLTTNKTALNESEAIKWLNSFTDRKNGLLALIAKEYNIKPNSKEDAAAQMYGEGFYLNDAGDLIEYGDTELALDFPDETVRNNIKKLATDPRIRQVYDETLEAINESRKRNGYPEIPRRDNYFLHFRAMDDTFSKIGLPFNPNDIRAKDLPTDINGMTADLKPGQPYFGSAKKRMGLRTSHSLIGGMERYLGSAKNQIYHIDDIQILRALRNYVADMYGQANGLEGLDTLSEEEAEARIKQVYDAHLSNFAKFLNEQANVLAGKTSLADRGLEGIIGRRGITTLNTINSQVGKNMVGFNLSSSLTNLVSAVQAFAKTNKYDSMKALSQTIYNRINSINGKSDGFVENDPTMIRRKGAQKLSRTPFDVISDVSYGLMSGVDSISSEFIIRAKYNELTRKGMGDEQAHIEAGKWASRILGDRSLGQQPHLYNSKMLGLFTKFQLEVRNQLDSQFYDTIQEANLSTEQIKDQRQRNAVKAAKITSTFVQLAVFQHLFGKAFETVAGYNPTFDIISVLIKTLGFDDDDESEDTVLDNIEQGFLELIEDLPYTSTFTGGRIPIQSALPVEELVTGKDEYGNKKSRLKTAAEIAPYYIMPGGYNQIKKTVKGLSMFDDDKLVTGSYTDSGDLRFPVEKTPLNVLQAGVFGQWASENARDYIENERAPLKEKQIQEYKELNIPIADYWKYREGLKEQKTIEEKFDYVAGLNFPVSKKNIMINNIVTREEKVDLTNYDAFASYEEFKWATKNPEKYNYLDSIGVSYKQYAASEDSKAAYNWAYENPEKYNLARAAAGDVITYKEYSSALGKIKADKDSSGKAISGSRKTKVIDYINSLDADYGSKLILFKTEYPSDDTYNYEIVEYLNKRKDISYKDMVEILLELGFSVDSNGNVRW